MAKTYENHRWKGFNQDDELMIQLEKKVKKFEKDNAKLLSEITDKKNVILHSIYFTKKGNKNGR